MSKEDVLNELKANGGIHRFDRHEQSWKKAFDLYRSMTGNNLSMKCSKCFATVKEWLQKP